MPKIIENKSIKGFKLQEAELKLLAYADDVAIFTEDLQCLIEAVRSVRKFSQVIASGVN